MSITPKTPRHGEGLTLRSRAARRFRRAMKGLGSFIAICCVTAAGIILCFYVKSPATRDAIGALISGDCGPESAFPNQDEINILLMGRDLDRDRQGRVVRTHGRTDTMMLAHIDFRRPSVSVLSVPRDTLVHIPGYRGKRRISYANAYGGPDLALDTVSEFLGVRPEYYLVVNFEAFEKAIDAIGGLNVTVDKQMDYDDNWGNLHIHLKPGKQVLNGKQAMGFVRYRQSNDGDAESDLARIGRQQQLIRAARAKLSSADVVFRIPAVLDIICNDIEGNLTPSQMMCLARFLKSLPPDFPIRMETLPAVEEDEIFVRADQDATRDLVRQMFFDNQQ